MSKFLDTQFSITGIKDFDINSQSYVKYDLVDYQYYTGNSIYPTDISGLFAWFKTDDLNNFDIDSSGRISIWYNSAPGHSTENLYNYDGASTKPIYDFNENSVKCEANADKKTFNQLYPSPGSPNFSGFLTGDRCWFVVYEFNSLRKGNLQTPENYFANYSTIINTDNLNTSVASTGFLGVYGNNIDNSLNPNVLAGSQEFVIVSDQANQLYPTASTLNSAFSSSNLFDKNIVSILKNNTTTNLRLRNNGCELLNTNDADYFASGCASLRIGTAGNGHGNASASEPYNYDASNISYYEILGYSKVPTDEDILKLEKYLFKKYFTNNDNLYIANQNFTSNSYGYAPINLTGSQYLTKNIDSLFNKTYGCSANFSTKAIKANYGDGYFLNVIPNVNNLITNFSLKYDGLTDKQAFSLIGFFQNSFEYEPLTQTDSYENVSMSLFYPYKDNAKIYFQDLDYTSVDSNINNIIINCTTAYDSNLDYKGYVVSDESSIRPFIEGKKYEKHDIVYYNSISSLGGYYWYTGQNSAVLNLSQSPTGVNSLFTRKFYFKPDLDFKIPLNPRFMKNEYEMTSVAYEQDGINKNILDLSLSFTNRSDKEAFAILKFLDDRCGFKLFEFILPEPYNKQMTFYCPEWNHSYKFKDNHDINVKFLEFKGNLSSDVYFNTIVKL
jgi:phage-related protein